MWKTLRFAAGFPHSTGATLGTPVFASADGVVVNAKYVGTWGNYVRINHGSLGVQTGYAHPHRSI